MSPGPAFGAWGEAEAARHLEAKGLRVVGRGVRTVGGELDLVAVDRGTLVFVEVKAARRSSAGAHPAEQVHARKRRRLGSAARAYLAEHPCPGPCRFDVVTVLGADRPLVEHFIGAFSL